MKRWTILERWPFIPLLLIPILTLAGTGISTLHDGYFVYHKGDLLYYFRASSLLISGQMPYRDFSFAYPPFSLVPFLLPHVVFLGHHTDFALYNKAFLAESCFWSFGVSLLLVRLTTIWRFPMQREATLCCYIILVLIFSELLPWRFDLFPALLTLAAFYFLLKEKSFAAGVCLGLAIAAKLYPVVIVPVFALYLITLGRRREAASLASASAGAALICLLPFVRIPLSTLFTFLSFHQKRGLEVESLGAGVLMIAHAAGWTNAKIVFNYGAYNLSCASAPAIIHCLPIIFIAMLGLALYGARRGFQRDITHSGRIEPETLARFTVAALLAFIAANKVLSTSYVIWILPFVPLLRPKEVVQVMVLFAMTITIYPYNFGELLSMSPFGIWLLNLRNLSILVLLFQLARPAKNNGELAKVVLTPSRLAEA
jgi:hypothetical protein